MQYESVTLAHETQGQGKPVIFLHGFPFDRSIWAPLVPLLQQSARLILPDLRGHGQSPAPEGVYSMREMAEDVVRLMDQLSIDRAVLVGHSMGGYISLAFAQAYPSRLMGLGLVATQAGADSPERRQSRLKNARLVPRRGVKPVVNGMLPKLTSSPDLLPGLTSLMMRANPAGVVGALRGMAERPDMTGLLSNIHVPAVVVAGAKDQLITMEAMQTMAQMLPKGWLVEIPEGGHMPMMEAPELVATALGQLLGMVS